MSKTERRLCDNLMHSRKLVDEIFDSYMLEYALRGYTSDEDLEKGLIRRLEHTLEERLRFIKKDLEAVRAEEVKPDDKG